jgi:diguanylate cyclase (GGDEF)-like protein/PAS domain S-box-containing protein
MGVRAVIARRRVSPLALLYAMNPIAASIFYVCGRLGVITPRPFGVVLGVLGASAVAGSLTERAFRRNRSAFRAHLRVAVHSVSVTAVIYMIGWGPALAIAYVFTAQENVAVHGAASWWLPALWSTLSLAVAELAVGTGLVASMLPAPEVHGLAALAGVAVIIAARMIGSTFAQKEHAEEQLRLREDRFRSLVQYSSDIVLVLDGEGTITYASRAMPRILGHDPADVVGRPAFAFVHPDDLPEVQARFGAMLAGELPAEPAAFRVRHVDGSWRHVEAMASNLLAKPSVGGIVVNLRDVTDRKRFEEQLAHQALHDALTGLPNRSLLLDRLAQALARAERAGTEVAVIFCDLDRFKLVNDSLGHEVGDRVLCAVARRLERTVRPGDTVARFGGDEFVILCEGLARSTDVAGIAERIQRALGEPIEVAGEEFFASASMGVALRSHCEGDAESLIRDADTAMYRAKEQGRGRFEIFDPETRAETLRRLHTESALRHALERGELCLHYQPVVDLTSGAVRSVEALLRWQHPDRGLLLPGEFIHVAEESGLIVPVGEWVLYEASRQAREWSALGGPASALQIAVNLSPRQLFEDDIVATVARAMQVSGLRAGQLALCLEVTEHMVMDSPERAEQVLVALKELGVQLAIDDFGTGYSSLAYLSRFPIDMLKIDRSFITGLDANPDHQAIVGAICDLARALGMEAIAEGVETEAEAAVLRRLGCPRVQGFHYGRPVPAEQITALLRTGARARPAPV